MIFPATNFTLRSHKVLELSSFYLKKVIFFIFLVFYSINAQAQQEEEKRKIMEDSLWQAVINFCTVAEKCLDKEMVTQKDIDCFLGYIRSHTEDSVQTSYKFIPFMATRDKTMEILTDQTSDMIGKKCNYKFITWDGWDGVSPYVMFQFKIFHDGYDDQFMVIVRATDNKISSIFSADSKL